MICKKKLTFYRQVPGGIISNFPKFGKNWWIKRSQAFNYLFYLTNKFKKKFTYSSDFIITKILSIILKCI